MTRPTCDLVIGDLDGGFSLALSWAADTLPKGLFGFASITLPTTTGDVPVLSCTGKGTRCNDETTVLFDVISGAGHRARYAPGA